VRHEFPTDVKKAAIERQNGRCAFCGIKLKTPWTKGPVDGNAHHLIPDSHGGSVDLSNCVYLCWGEHQLLGHGSAPFGIDKQGGSSKMAVLLKQRDFRYWNG